MTAVNYEKARSLLHICEILHGIEEFTLEEQTRRRLLEVLRGEFTDVVKGEPTMAILPPKEDEVSQELEELTIREIHGEKIAWNPTNNHCYELYPNDDVGKWIGQYDSGLAKIDKTIPDPESKEPNWTTQAAIGTIDPYKKDSLRRILMHGEDVAIAKSTPKKDGFSTVNPPLPNILAINKPGGALGFLYHNRLYNNPTSLLKVVTNSKTLSSGWINVCVKRPDLSGEMKWKSLYMLENS